MSSNWILSDNFVNFLEELIESSSFAAAISDYYPFVGWSLGGTMRGPDGVVTPIPPRYEVGLAKKSDDPKNSVRLSNKRFGYIIFSPKPEDVTSSRRLIDFDGKNIVVR